MVGHPFNIIALKLQRRSIKIHSAAVTEVWRLVNPDRPDSLLTTAAHISCLPVGKHITLTQGPH